MNKTRKQHGIMAIAAIIVIALSMTACDNGGGTSGGGGTPSVTPETPKVQDSPKVPMFAGKTAHITTNDTFTDTQWNKICSDIAAKFSAGYTNDGYGEAYEEAIGLLTEIIVEKNPTGYTNYKYIKNERTLYVCATKVNNINVYNVVEAILNASSVTTITVFGGSTTITVKGVFDKAGLDTAAGKIAGRLNNYYAKDVADYGETVTFDYYKENYATRGAVYIVEANPVGYTKFKMIGDGKTAYIALDYVDTDEVIGCMGMFLNNSTTVVKAAPTANNKGVLS